MDKWLNLVTLAFSASVWLTCEAKGGGGGGKGGRSKSISVGPQSEVWSKNPLLVLYALLVVLGLMVAGFVLFYCYKMMKEKREREGKRNEATAEPSQSLQNPAYDPYNQLGQDMEIPAYSPSNQT